MPEKEKGLTGQRDPYKPLISLGAEARSRTEMPLRAGDFESPASTSFTTPARARLYRRATKSQAKIC